MGFFVSRASGLFDTVEERFAESLSINVRIIIFRVIDTHLSISRSKEDIRLRNNLEKLRE